MIGTLTPCRNGLDAAQMWSNSLHGEIGEHADNDGPDWGHNRKLRTSSPSFRLAPKADFDLTRGDWLTSRTAALAILRRRDTSWRGRQEPGRAGTGGTTPRPIQGGSHVNIVADAPCGIENRRARSPRLCR